MSGETKRSKQSAAKARAYRREAERKRARDAMRAKWTPDQKFLAAEANRATEIAPQAVAVHQWAAVYMAHRRMSGTLPFKVGTPAG